MSLVACWIVLSAIGLLLLALLIWSQSWDEPPSIFFWLFSIWFVIAIGLPITDYTFYSYHKEVKPELVTTQWYKEALIMDNGEKLSVKYEDVVDYNVIDSTTTWYIIYEKNWWGYSKGRLTYKLGN